MAAEVCAPDKRNLGLQLCKDLPQLFKGMITTPSSFKLSAINSVLSVQWQNALIAAPDVRIHKWPAFKGFENQSEASIYEQNALTDNFVRNGKYIFLFWIIESLCLHRKMFTHNGGNQRVFLIDVKNNIYGTTDDDGNFMGFQLSLLNLENIIISDGQVSSKSPVKIVLLDGEELNANGAKVSGASFYNTLTELIDVDVAVLDDPAPTDSSIYVTVKTDCDQTAVSGLALADFEAFDAAGVAIVLGGGTYANGVYHFTSAADFVDGSTINLKVPSALTIKLYESLGAAEFDVP